jgi:hypothetical protein
MILTFKTEMIIVSVQVVKLGKVQLTVYCAGDMNPKIT